MTEPGEKITTKVSPKSTNADLAKTLSSIKNLGAGGTFTLIALIVAGFGWLKTNITDSIKSEVQNVVREEIKPLDDRLRNVEIEQEVRKRTQGITK